MDLKETLVCSKCSSKDFVVTRQATYVYTYKFNSDQFQNIETKADNLPFLFDNREKTTSDEYIICQNCGAKYPISLENYNNQIDLTILQKAIRADHVDNPQFLG